MIEETYSSTEFDETADSDETAEENKILDINQVDDPSLKLGLEMIELLQDSKAENILMFEVKGHSTLSDYVIICEGRSQAHCRGVAGNTEFNLKQQGERALGIEGEQEGNWVLMDYGNIIIHVFHPEIRKFYRLEQLFKSCPSREFSVEEEATTTEMAG